MLVVDASVAVKWLVQEDHSSHALRLLEGSDRLVAPELLWAELGSVLWQRRRRGEIDASVLSILLEDLQAAPVTFVAHRHLLANAFEIALAMARSCYDCLYLALAEQRACRMVTADRRFHDKVERSAYAGATLWIEDVP